MTERTTHTYVTFSRPFSLADVEETQPAGTYRIETVDATLDSLSFLAYRRVSTTIELPAVGTASLRRQMVGIDPVELEAALKNDADGDTEHTRNNAEQGSAP